MYIYILYYIILYYIYIYYIYIYISQPTFQRRSDVDPTLKMKQNPMCPQH